MQRYCFFHYCQIIFNLFFKKILNYFQSRLLSNTCTTKKFTSITMFFTSRPQSTATDGGFCRFFFLSLDCFLRNISLVRLFETLSSPTSSLRMADNRIRYIHYIIGDVFIKFRRLSQNANIGSASYGYFVKKFLI